MGVFGDLNEANIIGNITQDLELRHTPSGTAVTSFTVATNRSYKIEDEWKEEANFHNIVVWGNDAEYMVKKARKGTRVYVNGRLQTRSWETQEGDKKYKTEIVANKVILLDRYEKGPVNEQEEPSYTPSPKSSTESKVEEVINPDDLPF